MNTQLTRRDSQATSPHWLARLTGVCLLGLILLAGGCDGDTPAPKTKADAPKVAVDPKPEEPVNQPTVRAKSPDEQAGLTPDPKKPSLIDRAKDATAKTAKGAMDTTRDLAGKVADKTKQAADATTDFAKKTTQKTVDATKTLAVKTRDKAKSAFNKFKNLVKPKQEPDNSKQDPDAGTTGAGVDPKHVDLADPTVTDDEDKAALKAAKLEAERAAAERNHALEILRLEKKLVGLKARGYRKIRGVPVNLAFKGLAAAAGQAAKTNNEDLPSAVRKSADMAAKLAEKMVGEKRLPDGKPDWEAIENAMVEAATSRANGVHQTVAMGYLMSGGWDLALFEIEEIDEAKYTGPKERAALFALRGVIRSLGGFGEMGIRDLEAADGELAKLREQDPEGKAPGFVDKHAQDGIQLFMSMVHLYNNRFSQADALLAAVNRKMPNNPVAVFLSGERLAANGEYEKAAKSLESVLAKTRHKWLAEKIAGRIKAFRDNPDQVRPLVFDEVFFAEITKAYIAETANDSATMGKLYGWTQAVKDFGGSLKDKVTSIKWPYFGGDDDEPLPKDGDSSEAKTPAIEKSDSATKESLPEPVAP